MGATDGHMAATPASGARGDEESARRGALLEFAGAVGQALAAADGTDRVVPVLLDQAWRVVGWPAARFFSVQGDGTLRLAAAAGAAETTGSAFVPSSAWPNWLDAEPVWITDLEGDPRLSGEERIATTMELAADAEFLRAHGCRFIEGGVTGATLSASDCEVALLAQSGPA